MIFAAGYLELGLSQERHKLQHKNEAHIPPLLGVAPLGIVPLSKEHQFQYRYKTSNLKLILLLFEKYVPKCHNV